MPLQLLALLLLLASSTPLLGQHRESLPFPVAQLDTFADGGRADDRLRIVAITSTSLPDAKTVVAAWQDPRVIAWLDANAIALQYEHGNYGSHQPEISKLLERLPGVAAFRAGELIDFDEPPLNADELLDWFERVRTAELTREYAARRANEPSRKDRLIPRLVFAERLARLGLRDEADAEFTRVFEQRLRCPTPWQNLAAATSEKFEQRSLHMYLLSERPAAARSPEEARAATDFTARARRAAERDPATHSRLTALRDELAAAVEADTADHHARTRWLQLQVVVPDIARLRSWFAKAAAAPPPRTGDGWNDLKGLLAGAPAGSDADTLRDDILRALISAGAWQQAGEFIDQPIDIIDDYSFGVELARSWDEAPNKEMIDRAERTFALRSAVIYAALLAASRDEDAAHVADHSFKLVPDPVVRAAFVLGAKKCGHLRPFHVEWAEAVDAAKTDGEPLAPAIRKALADQPEAPR